MGADHDGNTAGGAGDGRVPRHRHGCDARPRQLNRMTGRPPARQIGEAGIVKAFILDRYGSSDSVWFGEMPAPEVRANDVLVQVHAAGVNLLDSKIRDGEFKLFLPYRLPIVLGN